MEVPLAGSGQQRRRHRRHQRWQPAARAERQQQGPEARQERQDVGRLLGHAHRRRALDEPEGRTVHRRARAARETSSSSRRSARCWRTAIKGDPLDCIGGVINDLTADSKGGVYFTMGGVYYASPKGVVTKYGENVTPNGIILSANEKTLYVTNGPTLAAFDVQPDGSLTNQREFAKLEGGGGDGSTIDAAGRIYVTTNAGVQVISPEGKYLGLIPTPRGVITTAFGGKDKKTLFILARGAKDAERRRSRQRRAGVVDPDDRAGVQGPRRSNSVRSFGDAPDVLASRAHEPDGHEACRCINGHDDLAAAVRTTLKRDAGVSSYAAIATGSALCASRGGTRLDGSLRRPTSCRSVQAVRPRASGGQCGVRCSPHMAAFHARISQVCGRSLKERQTVREGRLALGALGRRERGVGHRYPHSGSAE